MDEWMKRLLLVLILGLGGVGVPWQLMQEAGAQEKKPAEIKMPQKPLPEDSLITMDFQDADLSVLIKFMGELTGKNFLVSEQVRGKVTIISPKKITVGEAYKVFESVLEMHGFTAVPGTDAIKIIPSGIARQAGLEIQEGKEPSTVQVADRMITQIIPLEFGSSEEIRVLLTPLISKDGLVASYRPTNHLIITERASNIRRLLKIIEQIDVRVVEEVISIFPLEFAAAKSMAEKMTQLVAADQRAPAVGRAPAPATVHRIVKIIPDERTNSLIVLASQQDTEQIRSLIATLDKEAPKGRSTLHVRYLEHARSEDLAKVLNTIVGSKTKAAARPQQAAQAPGQAEEASITADKATNSLVITASPQEFMELEEVIKKLDTVRSQVLVEALIAEVSMEKALQIGMEWRLMDQPVEGRIRGFGGTDFGLISGVQQGTLSDAGMVFGVTRGFITIGGQQFVNLGGLLRAFQKDTDVNVLSTPHLLTMDNEKAKIVVADNVPILKTDLSTPLAAATTTTTNISVSRTFEYKDIGIQLEITPHISKGSMVRLELSTEVSNVTSIDPTNPGFVTTRKRQANTTVVVESGQMMVIGGLIRDDRNEETKRVPCVGNIPILGWLFKTYGGTKTKTNLLVFITPHIIRTPEDMEKATAKKKQDAEDNLKKLKKERENEVKDTFDMITK